MRIFNTLDEMLPITDPYIFNWECKNKGCWMGQCFTQCEKRPRGCPGFGRGLIEDPKPEWEKVKDERSKV